MRIPLKRSPLRFKPSNPAASRRSPAFAPKRAFVFPGQGLHYVGMGKGLCEAFPVAREVFDRADRLLGFSISKLTFEQPSSGTKPMLDNTAFTQPAMYVTAYAYWRVLLESCKVTPPDYVAGHSLGEYTALTAAGTLDFEKGLFLVADRGRFMAEAAAQRPGSMAAALGLPRTELETILDQARQTDVLAVALENSPKNTVIAGDSAAVDRAVTLAGRKIRRLPVSGAFHCSLMAAAEAQLGPCLQRTLFEPLQIPYIANVTGDINTEVDAIASLLTRQMQQPVRWRQTVQTLWELGVRTFVEVGPGKGLSKMIDDCLGELNTEALPTMVGGTDAADGSGGLDASFIAPR